MDMTQLNDYTTRSEAVCRRNDTISPGCTRNTVSKRGFGTKTATAFSPD